MNGCTTCGYVVCRCGEDQSNWMTLDQIAERILLPARRSLTPEQRKLFTHESVMVLARSPVGGLGAA